MEIYPQKTQDMYKQMWTHKKNQHNFNHNNEVKDEVLKKHPLPQIS
jgi:hypothetical protein